MSSCLTVLAATTVVVSSGAMIAGTLMAVSVRKWCMLPMGEAHHDTKGVPSACLDLRTIYYTLGKSGSTDVRAGARVITELQSQARPPILPNIHK